TRSFLRRLPGVDFRLARIAGGDPSARTLRTSDGEQIAYDYLLVATGGAAADFGIPRGGAPALHLYDVEDARALPNPAPELLERAAVMPDSPARRALLTFVIVGGGPTGVETAGALAEFRRHVMPHDYPTVPPEQLRIVLLEARDAVLGTFAASLQQRARR